jgi:transcriptional regulator with XRE-family HTH domain
MELLSNDANKLLKQQWQQAKSNGWTQAKMAKALSIAQPSLNQYLNGKIPINVEFVFSFCHVLNIAPELVGFIGRSYREDAYTPEVRFSTSGIHYGKDNPYTKPVPKLLRFIYNY